MAYPLHLAVTIPVTTAQILALTFEVLGEQSYASNVDDIGIEISTN